MADNRHGETPMVRAMGVEKKYRLGELSNLRRTLNTLMMRART
jgi:hypothetical protein